MKKRTIAKFAVNSIAAYGIGTFVSNVTTATLPQEVKLITKISTYVGAYAVSTLISHQVEKLIDEAFDDMLGPEQEETVVILESEEDEV